jgi:hypothetical protein
LMLISELLCLLHEWIFRTHLPFYVNNVPWSCRQRLSLHRQELHLIKSSFPESLFLRRELLVMYWN